MKKIIGILVVSLVTNQLIAQTAGPSAGAKVLSIAESKKVNGNAETTINGMPYSQYKAQQDALKLKQQQEQNIPIATPPKVEATGSLVQTTPAKTVAKPALTGSNSTNTGLKTVAVEKPAAFAKESSSLANVKPGQPVETQTAKPVEVITTNATPGSSESIITKLATVGVAGTTTPEETKATTTTAKMPEVQMNNQLKVQPEEEIKPSVNPVAPKLPVVPMQTSEKTKSKG